MNEKISFEQIHDPGAYNQSPFALLGQVRLFYAFNKYILSAWYKSKSGKLHTLVLEDENEYELLKKAIEFIKRIPTPWDRDKVLSNIIYALRRITYIDGITIRAKEEKKEKIVKELIKLIEQYGQAISISSYSSDLKYGTAYMGALHDNFTREPIWTNYWRKTKLNEYISYEEEINILKDKNSEIIGIEYYYMSYSMSGLNSSKSEYVKILPFKPIKIKVKREGRRAVESYNIGYKFEPLEEEEEIKLEPVNEEIKSKTLELINQILALQ